MWTISTSGRYVPVSACVELTFTGEPVLFFSWLKDIFGKTELCERMRGRYVFVCTRPEPGHYSW